jgi:endonuclease I
MKWILTCLLFLPLMVSAQSFYAVFPDLEGEELLDSVASNYRPQVVLPWSMARDTLFSKILVGADDSLECIYSGHKLYLDPTADPTEAVYLGGQNNGMNTEHLYPKSKGAEQGNAYSDMHHLFPTKIPVNSARSNDPFGEIPDQLTDKWFYRTATLSSIPPENIDAYSEDKDALFEPRESVKGDVARAVFYFYTMYKVQAFAADPNFFELQRAALCAWNEADPADSTELIRSYKIAAYQSGKENPFVLDCTLAHRSYCPEVPASCSSSSVVDPAESLKPRAVIFPNPVADQLNVEVQLPVSAKLSWSLYTVLGQEGSVRQLDSLPAGTHRLVLDLPDNIPGCNYIRILVESQERVYALVVPFIKA